MFSISLNKNRKRMNFVNAISFTMKKRFIGFVLGILMFSAGYSQSISIDKTLFGNAFQVFRDSSNIAVPINLSTFGTNGFGDTAVFLNTKNTFSFQSNIFAIVMVPYKYKDSIITDTTKSLGRLLGAQIIGRYTFNNKQVPYTTFVNGIIPKLGVGVIADTVVFRVVSTLPFISSDSSVPVIRKRTASSPAVKSFAIAGSVGNTTAINYDPTHSAMFFGFCGTVLDAFGNLADTSISLMDSTAGSFKSPSSYDSVFLINSSFHTLVNLNQIVYSGAVTPKTPIMFPFGSLKAGEYYTLMLKAKDDSGFVSTKCYFIINSNWVLNLGTVTKSTGCSGDTVKLYVTINQYQAGFQFGIYDNFPGLLYSLNWGDPNHPGTLFLSYSQLMNNNGQLTHRYDTTSCFNNSKTWPISTTLINPFQGNKCSFKSANATLQIFSSVKAKFGHVELACMYNPITDNTPVTFKDSSYAGSNNSCTGTAYYTWYRSYVGCGNINDTATNPFIAVDSSSTIINGVSTPTPVAHWNHLDSFTLPGKYFIELIADNKSCTTSGFIDSINVVAPPKAKFMLDSAGVQDTIIKGCSPLTVFVDNLSDSTCSEKWKFHWDVLDSLNGNILVPYGPSNYTFLGGSTFADSITPKFVFNQIGIYKIRLVGSNACSHHDTAAYRTVIVEGSGGVAFPNGNSVSSYSNIKTNAFCIYGASKTVNFDSAFRTPAIDTIMKPHYGGTASPDSAHPYSWTVTDIAGTHTFVGAGTPQYTKYPIITFTPPASGDGDYKVYVSYASTCGVNTDSFELFLNRQVYPHIIIPSRDTSVCANTASLNFTGTVSGVVSSLAWIDPSSPAIPFGNGLNATLNNVGTKTIKFWAYKPQPNGCADTFATRKITLLPIVSGNSTTASTCSGLPLNFNPSTVSNGITYTWTSNAGPTIYGNTPSGTGIIKDVINGNGAQDIVQYTITPYNSFGCPGQTFTYTVTILPYPTIYLTDNTFKDTICSGSKSHLFVGSNTPGAIYSWSTSYLGSNLSSYNQGSWNPASGNIPTNFSGPYLDVSYTNNGNSIDSFRILTSVSVANGACSSPKDSITMYVIPGPTQPKANLSGDSNYLCNQFVSTLNATIPNASKGEIGTWTQPNSNYPTAIISNPNSPTSPIVVAPNNTYDLYWTISSPLANSYGCQSLTDSFKIFDRPSVTQANIHSRDTTLCNYAGNNITINLSGNIDPTRPWEVVTWTANNAGAIDHFGSTGIDTSHKYNDQYIFRGPTGEYDLVYTISNDASCPVTIDTLKIGAGFGNNFIQSDTAICFSQPVSPLFTGSLPTGGGGSYTYQWWSYQAGTNPAGATAIPGATSQNYTPLSPGISTSYFRRTSSVNCPIANLKSNVATITVYQSPKTGLIVTKKTDCGASGAYSGFVLDSSIIKIDTLNYPVDTSAFVYSWYVNGVLKYSGPYFLKTGLYTITNPGDSAIVELRDSSKHGCGTVVSIKDTFYTRIKPNPGFTASTLTSCNTTTITFNDTTNNAGLYQGFYWDFGEGDVANTYNPPAPGSYTYNSVKGYDTLYFVKLTAWTACLHDSVTVTDTVRILATPRASFYASKYSGCAPLRDSLFNTTIGQIDAATWSWYYPQTPSDSSYINVNPKDPVVHVFPFTAGVRLKVYNQCGVDSTPIQTIQVAFTAINLKLGLTYTDQYACAPHTVNQLYNAIGADIVQMWSYPINGSPNSTPDATTNIPAGIQQFTFTDTGKFVIKVRASNFCDTVVMFDTVRMFQTPFPQFKLVKDTFCVGDVVMPQNNTNTPNVSTFWEFAYAEYNGSKATTLPSPKTSTSTNPSVVFTNPGVDSIALATTIAYPVFPSPGYCSDTTKVAYTVVTNQKANFTISNNHPTCIPATVTFTNNSPSSSTPPLVWNLNYPNGPTVTGANSTTYTYQDTGTYTVVLDTKSAGGCLYTDTEKVVITSPYAQVWKYDHGYICGSTPVRFQVMNPSGVDSMFVWHFGDNTTTSTAWNSPTVFHSYSNCGNYYPTVDLISKGGCKYTLNWNTGDTIKIDSVKAGFVYSINKNCGNTNVCYTDMSNACSGFNANSWSWNFGDIGLPTNFSNLQNPCHAYHTTDTDTIQLQVTANSGCTSTINVPIYIKVNSIPQITTHVINPYNGVVACTGQTVIYTSTAVSIDPIKDYVWTFGNTAGVTPAPTYNGSNVTNTYPSVGSYFDTLTVSTIYGCIAQFFDSVHVLQTPVIAIAQNNPPQLCRGVPFNFSATTNDPGTTIFTWGPASGNNPAPPSIVCDTANCSKVTVTATTSSILYVQGLASNGCTGYGDTVRFNVIQPITLTVTPLRDTICIGDSVQLNSVAVGTTAYAWNVDSSLHYNGHFNDSVANPIAHPVRIGDNIYTLRVSNSCFSDSGIVHVIVGEYPTVKLGYAYGLDTIPNPIQTGSTINMLSYLTLSNDTFKTFTWTPINQLNCTDCEYPVATVAGNQLYTVKATTIYGCSKSDSMYIKTFCQNSQVYIPNAFTPDGDGRNDVLMVRGSGIKLVKNFRIYNRWGQVVFERANFNVNDPQFGWDGKIRNTNSYSPPDVYVYYCEVVCDDDIPFTYQGNITLIK